MIDPTVPRRKLSNDELDSPSRVPAEPPVIPTMTEVVLHRGGVKLRGTVTGNGATVLLLHAGGERRDVWSPVMAPLNACGFRTVAFDLRGHGASTGSATSLRTIRDDVRGMILSDQGPVVVVGASLGGLAALAALADRPTVEHVAGLVLVDVVPDPDPASVRRWLHGRGILAGRRELVEDILAQGRDLLAIAAGFDRPMLLVRGSDSPLNDADVDRLHSANPRLTIAHLPAAGHLVARDAPEELARIIREHLQIWLSESTRPNDVSEEQ